MPASVSLPSPARHDDLSVALDRERQENARLVNLIRLVGISAFFALFFILGTGLGLRAWQGNLAYFGPYWLVTVGLFLASRRFEAVNQLATLAIAFVDMPMVFLLNWATFPTSPNHGAIAGYSLGIFVFLLIVEALSLQGWKIWLSALSGAVCEACLQYLADISVGAIISTFVIMGLAAATCVYGSRRIVTLLGRIVANMKERQRTLADHDKVQAALREKTNEMEIASRIQTSILPRTFKIPTLDIAATMLPASEVGGDYYDVRPAADGCWIGIGDVSGHGLTAGLVMMMVQTAIAALVRAEGSTPEGVIQGVNAVLHENIRLRLEVDEHMTLSLFRLHDDGRLVVAGAHEEIVVHRAATGECELLDTPGTWVGVVADIRAATVPTTYRLYPGDTVVLYTDGVIEARSELGERWGTDRLLEEVLRGHALPVADLCAGIMDRVARWGPEQKDDVTLMVVRFRGVR